MNVEIADRLVEIRKKNGLSQEQLAEKIGVSRQAVSKWERAESSPDTDNLIALARLYGVSLDELLGTASKATEADGAENAEFVEENNEENRSDEVHIGFDGIHVHDRKGTIVDIGMGGIHVKEAEGDVVSVDKDGVAVNGEKVKRGHIFGCSPFGGIISVLCVTAFLAAGIFFNGWYWCWLILLAVPVLTSLISAVRKRRLSEFCYPVLVVIVFMALGFAYGWWHPAWLVFLTIPLYYCICGLMKR